MKFHFSRRSLSYAIILGGAIILLLLVFTPAGWLLSALAGSESTVPFGDLWGYFLARTIPLYPGVINYRIESLPAFLDNRKSTDIYFWTQDSPDSVFSFYEERLQKKGWVMRGKSIIEPAGPEFYPPGVKPFPPGNIRAGFVKWSGRHYPWARGLLFQSSWDPDEKTPENSYDFNYHLEMEKRVQLDGLFLNF